MAPNGGLGEIHVETCFFLAVLDNLVKGASGQALQNLNLLMGLPETTGLLQQAMFP